MDFFYKLQRLDNNYKIVPIKTNNISKYIIDIFEKYNDIQTKLSDIKDKNIKYTYDRFLKINTNNNHYLWTLLDFDINNSYNILSKNFETDFYIAKLIKNGQDIEILGNIETIKDKYKYILYNMQSIYLYNQIKKFNKCKREELLFVNKLKIISYLFKFLEIGGKFFLSMQGFCNIQIIEIYYALTFMFEYVIVYNSISIVCINFNPVITCQDIELLMKKSHSIEPKHDLDNFIIYLFNNINYHIEKYNLLLQGSEQDFLNIIMNELVSSFHYYNKKSIDTFLLDYNFNIIEHFKNIYLNKDLFKVSSSINSREGNVIKGIIEKNNYKTCLEIGMANGISSFYILSNPKTTLISLDPYQDKQWNNIGIKLLKEFKFIKRHKLYQKKSFVALPLLIKKKLKFDFIFIDGFHTFDYTLLDFFYSNLLLKINGTIVIDDALHHGVAKCVKFIESNYKFYKKEPSPVSCAVFYKISNDMRETDFHKDF
jgi:hypothetical protein